ncbi:hypothetical protein [Streptomyces sp. NBC_00198]|uniref:hypothetical protein n=1 Tax=Streptomyces sp. NBC_00198 TaxID=2975677 RepID=UPI0022593E1B|nr:hypothetical protein [Streptomyces sp. NBC_00198]MCX5285952.1 hypothetical protein [Streptomyces sp. NBC_00198]MCX5286261.1 hypothetical protein [Streptomyces sp. NBC_00198]
MHRTATVLLAAALIAVAGCSSSDSNGDDKSTPAATTSASAAQPTKATVAGCTDALAAGEQQDSPECADLSTDDLFKAIQDANGKGQDALKSAIASASAAAG